MCRERERDSKSSEVASDAKNFEHKSIFKKARTTGLSFVSRAATKKERRSKETETDVPELDFISNLCTGAGGQGVMKRELLMTKKPTSWLQGYERFFLSYHFTFLSTGGWTFPSGREMAGGDKDHVKTRFQRQNRLYCPILNSQRGSHQAFGEHA